MSKKIIALVLILCLAFSLIPVEAAAATVMEKAGVKDTIKGKNYTVYDENGNKIDNLAGMTRNLGNTTVTENLDGKIFDLISSAKIVNGLDHKSGYEMTDGALTIYTGSSENYASGWITLQVNQYNAEGELLATGNVRVHTFEEPIA